MSKLHALGANDEVLTPASVVPVEGDATLTKLIATIGGKQIKVPEGGGGGGGFAPTGHKLTCNLVAGDPSGGRIIALKSDGTVEQISWSNAYGQTRVLNDVVLWAYYADEADKESGNAYNAANVLQRVVATTKDATVTFPAGCFLRGTMVNTVHGAKPVEEITYGDRLLVWDFDAGTLAAASPLWIKRAETGVKYWVNRFASGRAVRTTGTVAGHRFFSLDADRFLYNTECVGHRVKTLGGSDTLVEAKPIEKTCEYYNLMTRGHINCFLNGVLAGCSLNNGLYEVKDMKFVKDDRALRPYSEFEGRVSREWYDGLRLGESSLDLDYIARYYAERIGISK